MGVCATLKAAKAQVEHAVPHGEWHHSYRHIWDYMIERAQHRRAVAFRIEVEAVPTEVSSEDQTPL